MPSFLSGPYLHGKASFSMMYCDTVLPESIPKNTCLELEEVLLTSGEDIGRYMLLC